jgi:hypothetical protein
MKELKYKIMYSFLIIIFCLLISCTANDKNKIQENIENNNQHENIFNKYNNIINYNNLVKSLDELNLSEIYINGYSSNKIIFEDIEKYNESEWKITEKCFLLYSIEESLINIRFELYSTPEEARKGMLLTYFFSSIKYEINDDIGIGDVFAWYNENNIMFSRANVVVGIRTDSNISMVDIAKEIDQKIIDITK